jgi:cell division protein FtsI (penicillin-binding protein 3)
MATPSLANQWMRRERRMRIRLAVVAAVVLVGFVGVMGRALQLQVQDNQALEWVASKQYQAVVPVAARRGKIFDNRGKELAVSMPATSIYADGRLVKDVNEAVRSLTSVLGLSGEVVSELRAQLSDRKRFVWVKRKVTPEVTEKVKAMNIPGVRFVEESRRVYPSGKLASTVLGAVGTDAEGLAGIEMAYNDELLSKHNTMTFQRDARGRLIYSPVAFKDQVDVGTVTLTVDKTIQFIVESALDRAVEESKARSGIVVVMDPKTGAIFAMATSPNFNPNDYTKYPQSTWRNRAISDTFEPGSTFKVLTVAAALDQGLVKPDQKFDCNSGAITIGNATIHDHDPYGILTVSEIIKVSSNIGAYKVGKVLGSERLYESLRQFGIGQKTGLEFPGEVAGVMRAGSKWGPVELATISFGQGVTATPLQLAAAMATIANGGVRMKPYIVQKIENSQGDVIFQAEPTPVATVIRPETATLMLDIMKSVVGQGGTAKRAASEEFSVAGKTGTAQKVTEGTGKYAAGKFFASFVGVSPVEDPRLVIFVGIDEPQNGHFGGQIAGPVFREIAEASLHYLTVPGKMSPVIVQSGAASSATQTAESTAASLAEESFAASVVRQRTTTNTATKAKKKTETPQLEELVLPDMTGWPMRRVVVALRGVDARMEFAGGGRAVSQVPAPGVMVKKGDRVQVRFELPQ